MFIRFLAITVMLITSSFNSSWARSDVVLNPVDVSGKLKLNNIVFDKVQISASSPPEHASTQVINTQKLTELDYQIIVNVEENSSRFYTFHPSFTVANSTMSTGAYGATITDGQNSILDFTTGKTAPLEVKVNLPQGYEISSVNVTYNNGNNKPFSSINGNSSFITATMLATTYLRMRAIIRLTNGATFEFERDNLTIAPDITHVEEFTIDITNDIGSIGGTLDIQGPRNIIEYLVGVNSTSGGYKTHRFYPPYDSNKVDWSINDIPAAEGQDEQVRISISARYSDNAGRGYVLIDQNQIEGDRSFYLQPNEHKIINLITQQASVSGELILSGSLPADQLKAIKLNNSYVNLTEMSYLIVTTTGVNYLNNKLTVDYYLTPENSDRKIGKFELFRTPSHHVNLTMSAGEHLVINEYISTGSLTTRFRVNDGRLVSSPRLNTLHGRINDCLLSDENGPVHYWSSTSQDTLSEALPVAELTTFGPAGNCENLIAYAAVDASVTSFGQISAKIIPGVDGIIDIGGPTLTIDVLPNTVFNTDTVSISGTATSDSGVNDVSINGHDVFLRSTNNPSDPNEVSFNRSFNFPEGIHEIYTIATDNSGKKGEDKRSIEISLPFKVCDVNNDTFINITDIRLIFQARNQAAKPLRDSRDFDQDGTITTNDARSCQAQCDLARCALQLIQR